MKVVVEFDMDNTEDMVSHKLFCKMHDMASVLFEIQYNLKKRVEFAMEGGKDAFDAYSEELFELLEEHKIDMEDIYP
jgi:rubrerythrin